MAELCGVEICLFPLTRLIAYTTACCYRTSRDYTTYWFAENDLLLNAEKSEVMVIGTSSQLRLAESIGTVTVVDTCLTVSRQWKSLSVIFNPRLTV